MLDLFLHEIAEKERQNQITRGDLMYWQISQMDLLNSMIYGVFSGGKGKDFNQIRQELIPASWRELMDMKREESGNQALGIREAHRSMVNKMKANFTRIRTQNAR